MNWQPIETAPHDMHVLLFAMVQPMPGRELVPHIWIDDWWLGDALNGPRWRNAYFGQPTHWMPLPDPPSLSVPEHSVSHSVTS